MVKRRTFFRLLGLGAVAAAAAPEKLVATLCPQDPQAIINPTWKTAEREVMWIIRHPSGFQYTLDKIPIRFRNGTRVA